MCAGPPQPLLYTAACCRSPCSLPPFPPRLLLLLPRPLCCPLPLPALLLPLCSPLPSLLPLCSLQPIEISVLARWVALLLAPGKNEGGGRGGQVAGGEERASVCWRGEGMDRGRGSEHEGAQAARYKGGKGLRWGSGRCTTAAHRCRESEAVLGRCVEGALACSGRGQCIGRGVAALTPPAAAAASAASCRVRRVNQLTKKSSGGGRRGGRQREGRGCGGCQTRAATTAPPARSLRSLPRRPAEPLLPSPS